MLNFVDGTELEFDPRASSKFARMPHMDITNIDPVETYPRNVPHGVHPAYNLDADEQASGADVVYKNQANKPVAGYAAASTRPQRRTRNLHLETFPSGMASSDVYLIMIAAMLGLVLLMQVILVMLLVKRLS